MEYFLWFFVFVVFLVAGDSMNCHWYLIYRYRWEGNKLVQYRDPIDGVFATHADAAVQIAVTRNNYRTDEKLEAVFCYYSTQRQLASELDGRHECEWWSQTDFVDWMCQPAYEGNYLTYAKASSKK